MSQLRWKVTFSYLAITGPVLLAFYLLGRTWAGGLGVSLFVFFLVSGLLVFLLVSGFTRPLKVLLSLAVRLAQGNSGQQVEVPTRDELGTLERYLNEAITQLQRYARDLAQERNQANAILAAIADALLVVDWYGRLVLFNHAAEKMFGLNTSTVLNKHLLEVIRNHELDQEIKYVLMTGKPVEKELRLFPTTSQVFLVHGAPVSTGGKRNSGAVVVIRDLTSLRQLKQMRTEFVANVSHELRTPLTSIKGFVETLLDGSLEDPQLCRRFLDIINAETNRLQRLIDDLLTLSALESGKGEAVPETAALPALAQKVKEVLAPLAAEKKVALELFLPENLPPLRISEDFLEQVLMNLVDNAIKYTPAGGRVTVTAWVQNGRVKVEVADTGIGIPKESLPRIFERFYRVDKARSRELGGTGLGLAIVKHILDRCGGKITVNSEPGKGSTFTFTLRHL